MTPITYVQASELLGMAYYTIKQAVARGALTKLPREGLEQRLVKEQVELFKGKRITLSSLSVDERTQWEQYRAMATAPARESEVPQGQNFTRAAPPMELLRVKGTQEQIAAFYQTLQTA